MTSPGCNRVQWPWRLISLVLIFLLTNTIWWPPTITALQQAPMQTHGQASGDVTDSGAVIWTRTNRTARIAVETAFDPTFIDSQITESVLVDARTDFAVKVDLTDLEPSQRYYYRLIAQDPDDPSVRSVGPSGTFVTAPRPDEAASLTFTWTGDSWAQLRPFRIFDAIQVQQSNFFLYLGDTIYADLSLPPARTIDQYRRAYQVNRRDDALRRFLETTSTYVIWDDHEVQDNFDRTHPRIPIGRQAFLEYWPIRTNAEDPARLYRLFRWGHAADLIILDTRQYRSPSSLPDTTGKTMLGEEQKAWLKAALLNSTATFKFIATSVPLRFHGQDSWEGYTTERQELFDFITQNNLKNIIFLSADVHYAGVINHPEGFKEIFVGPIGQLPSRDLVRGRPETEFSYNRGDNYGLVRVRGDQIPAWVEIVILDEENTVLHTTMVVEE